MDPSLPAYVMRYYGRFMTREEQLAHRHLMATEKVAHGQSSKAVSGLLSDDPVVLNLIRDGREWFMGRTAARILAEHSSEVFLNYCPRCGALAKTPKAHQCRVCRHEWHNSSNSA
jgi:hypothetical protein